NALPLFLFSIKSRSIRWSSRKLCNYFHNFVAVLRDWFTATSLSHPTYQIFVFLVHFLSAVHRDCRFMSTFLTN
ncbi:MAG: hypothetical protein ACTSV9_05365, partial [Candidatus Thorarchaeota archaeon]